MSLALLLEIDINQFNEKKVKQKKEKDKKSEQREKIESIIKEIKGKIKDKPYERELSETDKKELVEKLYENLDKSSHYMKKFYETLEILDAGYQSDYKEDALRFFREIQDIPVIPENRINELKVELSKFLKKEYINYTSFKKEVLAKFVVNLDFRQLTSKNQNITSASYITIDIEEKDKKKKVESWLKDIYIVRFYSYNDNLGLKKLPKQSYQTDDNII